MGQVSEMERMDRQRLRSSLCGDALPDMLQKDCFRGTEVLVLAHTMATVTRLVGKRPGLWCPVSRACGRHSQLLKEQWASRGRLTFLLSQPRLLPTWSRAGATLGAAPGLGPCTPAVPSPHTGVWLAQPHLPWVAQASAWGVFSGPRSLEACAAPAPASPSVGVWIVPLGCRGTCLEQLGFPPVVFSFWALRRALCGHTWPAVLLHSPRSLREGEAAVPLPPLLPELAVSPSGSMVRRGVLVKHLSLLGAGPMWWETGLRAAPCPQPGR